MLPRFCYVFLAAMCVGAQQRPAQRLYVYRDFLKPGSDDAYRKIEIEAARVCAEMKCPHPYLGIESLTGPKEAWWLNGFRSDAEEREVAAAYANNTKIRDALALTATRKQALITKPLETSTRYLPEASRGSPWCVGAGRFLVITVTRSRRAMDGAVFEAPDGTRYVIRPAHTREQAGAIAQAGGYESRIFAVRPYWSMPAEEWVAADPEFWRTAKPITR
ncbi:MAG TPA: hypothetical protein VJN43_07635 [Bryobacteraceae bacterium]|nr:hypothetical protein [Bryobacteraceae bacterium]